MGVCRVNERSSRREWVDRRAWKAEAFSKVHTPTGGVCGGLANCHSAVKRRKLVANDATMCMLPPRVGRLVPQASRRREYPSHNLERFTPYLRSEHALSRLWIVK